MDWAVPLSFRSGGAKCSTGEVMCIMMNTQKGALSGAGNRRRSKDPGLEICGWHVVSSM
jgi:hypothetical protein